MSVPGFEPNKTAFLSRIYYTVENDKQGKITKIDTKELNALQRILRSLFHWAGAYKETFTGKEVRAMAATKGIATDLAPSGKAALLYQKIITQKGPVKEQSPPQQRIAIPEALEECVRVLEEKDLELPKLKDHIEAAKQARDKGEVALAIREVVAAGSVILDAAKQTEDPKLGKKAQEIAAFAQKAGNEAKKAAPADAAIKAAKTEANELAASVRVHLKTQNFEVVGLSRSGKTTMMNMVKDVCHVGGEMTIYHGTVDPEFRTNNIQGWNFNISDNPGWGERSNVESNREYRNDDTIRNLIRDGTKTHFNGDDQDLYQNIDTFIFTFTIKQGIGPDEVAALKEFLKEVPEGANKILAITRSENAGVDVRMEHIEALRQHAQMGPLLKTHFKDGKNVLLSGCLEKAHFDDPELTERMLDNLNHQARALMDALIPQSAKDRKAFLENHSRANAERIKQFNEKEFENQREESILKRGEGAIDAAKEAGAQAKKATDDKKLPYNDKVDQIREAASKIAEHATDVSSMIDIAEGDVAKAKTRQATAKAQALLAKARALQEGFEPFKKEREKYILQLGELSIAFANEVKTAALVAKLKTADQTERSALVRNALDNINTKYSPQVREMIDLADRDVSTARIAHEIAQEATPLDEQTVAQTQKAFNEAEDFLRRATMVKRRFEEVIEALKL